MAVVGGDGQETRPTTWVCQKRFMSSVSLNQLNFISTWLVGTQEAFLWHFPTVAFFWKLSLAFLWSSRWSKDSWQQRQPLPGPVDPSDLKPLWCLWTRFGVGSTPVGHHMATVSEVRAQFGVSLSCPITFTPHTQKMMFFFFFSFFFKSETLSPHFPQGLTSFFQLCVPRELKLLKLNQVGKKVSGKHFPSCTRSPHADGIHGIRRVNSAFPSSGDCGLWPLLVSCWASS